MSESFSRPPLPLPNATDGLGTRQLVAAGERVVMSTGDHPLTACHVSRELGMAPQACAILDVREGGGAGDVESRLRWQV